MTVRQPVCLYVLCGVESGSLQAHPGCVQILMAVVDYKTQLHRPRTVSLPPPAWSALVTARSSLSCMVCSSHCTVLSAGSVLHMAGFSAAL